MPRSGDRQKCLHPGCGKSFARKEHLARHVRSHKQTNRYTCQFCQREFTRRFDLHTNSTLNNTQAKYSSIIVTVCNAISSGMVTLQGPVHLDEANMRVFLAIPARLNVMGLNHVQHA